MPSATFEIRLLGVTAENGFFYSIFFLFMSYLFRILRLPSSFSRSSSLDFPVSFFRFEFIMPRNGLFSSFFFFFFENVREFRKSFPSTSASPHFRPSYPTYFIFVEKTNGNSRIFGPNFFFLFTIFGIRCWGWADRENGRDEAETSSTRGTPIRLTGENGETLPLNFRPFIFFRRPKLCEKEKIFPESS